MTRLVLLPLVFALVACHRQVRPSGEAAMCAEPVATGSGAVSGVADAETATCAWRGIPYARAPVGELRWRAPQPPERWEGVRVADRWGRRCMQLGGMMWNNFNADPSGGMSEDCLYLNVWRPRKPGVFPVMVWIHGGGYGLGSANTPMYWGDRLAAERDVVVVSIAYRLGVLGFLALPGLRAEDAHGSVGGYGTLDQIAALRWVRENIGGFGGDSENVTIFGESAGGWSVCTLAATPLARGLFRRAAMQSGGCEQTEPLDIGYARGGAIAGRLGCRPDDLRCLRKVDADRLVDAGEDPTFTRFSYGPHHDGHVLSGPPLEALRRGEANVAQFLAGTTRDELRGNVAMDDRDLDDVEPDDYEKALRETLGFSAEEAQRLVRLYPLESHGGRPVLAFGQMASDSAFICPTDRAVSALAAGGVPTWLYRYDFEGLRFMSSFGAGHGTEIPVQFASTDRRPMSLLFPQALAERARPLGRAMRGYWTSFARTGNPNAGESPEWPPFSADAPRLLVLGEQLRVEPSAGERCRFWGTRRHDFGW